jgi:hypothetical protein
MVASVATAIGCLPAEETSAPAHSPPADVVAQNPSPVQPPRRNMGDGSTATNKKPHQGYKEAERTFEDLLSSPDASEPDPNAFGGANFGHPKHDDAKLAAVGIRKIEGKQLTVYTDLPRGDVDDYPKVFDLALPQWQSYFNLPADAVAKWRMTLYVIKDKDLFRREGLIDEGLPPFQHGYQRGFEMWVYEQPS